MRLVLYTHSLVSDWNHGNAHFLRGVLRELQARGHGTLALEPEDGWSRQNLVASHGAEPIARFHRTFPELAVQSYGSGFDHAAAVDDADVVLVHEWTDPALIAQLGTLRRNGGRFTLLFHDTHHRAISNEATIAGSRAAGLRRHPGVRRGAARALSEARLGPPGVHLARGGRHAAVPSARACVAAQSDLVWIGNWGDGERAQELREFLLEPSRRLGLTGTVRGVRYPEAALAALSATALRYGGWIANAEVPAAFAAHRVTVHVPRAPMSRRCQASPRSASSRRWPAAFR